MLLDLECLFSDAQAITNTATSTNVVKMASTQHNMTEVAFGEPIPLLIQVVEDFEGLTSLSVEVQTAAADDAEEWTTLVQVKADTDELTAGYVFPINFVPKGNLGYMRLYYNVEGTATAGKITAGVVAAHDHSFQDM